MTDVDSNVDIFHSQQSAFDDVELHNGFELSGVDCQNTKKYKTIMGCPKCLWSRWTWAHHVNAVNKIVLR